MSFNGKTSAARIIPGKFLELRQAGKAGDVIDIEFDMEMRLVPLNAAHPEMVALMTGPLLLFPMATPDVALSRTDLLAARRGADGDWQVKEARGTTRLKPFATISNEEYRLYSRVEVQGA